MKRNGTQEHIQMRVIAKGPDTLSLLRLETFSIRLMIE